jgi:hypothetical protein
MGRAAILIADPDSTAARNRRGLLRIAVGLLARIVAM